MRNVIVVAALVASVAALALQVTGYPPRTPARAFETRAAEASPRVDKSISAREITGGTLAMERMPGEVTLALELHSNEIVKTAQAVQSKQERVFGACAPGSAIRVIGVDGSVSCQKVPVGVVSVAAIAGTARYSTTATAQGSVPGGLGRFQLGGADDFLVVPIQIPDGAVVTGFSYTFYDDDAEVDGFAFLYRTDDQTLATVSTGDASDEVRSVTTRDIQNGRVDNTQFGYLVYLAMSQQAGKKLMPIAAAVSYRMP